MLTEYKREEDTNFKQKFEQLVEAEENRAKIKETINNVKNNLVTINAEDTTYQANSKSDLITTKKLKRTGSLPQFTKKGFKQAQNVE